MPMQPSPRADTSRLLLPNLRFCIVSPFCCFGPNHLVSNPERIPFALLNGFEAEGNGCVSCRADTDKDGPRSCRRVRGRDERLILREVLLHRRATANPGIAVQLRTRCLVLAVARDCVQSCAVDLPVHRREHVTNDIRPHCGPFRRESGGVLFIADLMTPAQTHRNVSSRSRWNDRTETSPCVD